MKKIPQTATEIRFLLKTEAKKELINWLADGGIIGKELNINIDHFDCGNLGVLKAKVIKWVPYIKGKGKK